MLMYKKNMGRDLSGICTIFKVFTYTLFLMNSQQVFALFGKLFHIKKISNNINFNFATE